MVVGGADHSNSSVKLRDRILVDDEAAPAFVAGLGRAGLAQCLALIPGTSRAGVTLTMGLVLGLSRAGAARYSLLLAIPVIFLAGVFEGGELAVAPGPVSWGGLGLGILVSAVSAYLTIRWFLHFVQRSGMAVFMAYRVALAGAIFYGFA